VLLADLWVEKIALLVEETTRALEKSKIDKLGPSSRRNSTRTRIEEEEDLTEGIYSPARGASQVSELFSSSIQAS